MSEQIRRVAVWSGWLRLVHGALAVATLLLLATGWLIGHAPSVAASAVEIHYIGAGVLVFALALRLFLGLFGKGAERLEHMLPRPSEARAMRDSLLFYLSLGRTRLPNWYAHNPLWKPVYLALLLALTLSVVTGWLMPDTPVLGRVYLPAAHRWLAELVGLVVLAHLFSVVLQDVRGRHADISAMLSGDRYFEVERTGLVRPEIPQVSINLDDIRRR